MGCPERLTSDKAESNLHGGILSGGAHLNYKPGLNCNPRNTSYQSGRMRRSYVPHRNYLNVRSIQMQTHTNTYIRAVRYSYIAAVNYIARTLAALAEFSRMPWSIPAAIERIKCRM